MSDADLRAKWATITDTVEALETLQEHSIFLGTDPYYADMDAALWAMVERVLKENKKPVQMIGRFRRSMRSTRYDNKEPYFGPNK